MNDDDMLTAMRNSLASVKDSLTDVHLDRPPEAITARARSRRLARGVTGAGAVGLALGLALTLPSGQPTARPTAQPSARPVHVNLDAWSVNTTSAGLIDISIRELKDPATLRRALADAGVPATVTFGKVCTTATGNLPQLGQVLHKQHPADGSDVVMTVNPAAMPPGTELVIGVAQTESKLKARVPALIAGFSLAKEGSPLTCHVPHIVEKKLGAVKTGVHK